MKASSSRSDRESQRSVAKDQIRLPSQSNWLNWRALKQPIDTPRGYEYPLYSDAHITGEMLEGLGPYCFLNSVPGSYGAGVVNAPIVLRTAIYLPSALPDMSKPDDSFYHGGYLPDELAALTSLVLGVRILAGGISREFGFDNDPLGRPREGWSEPKPTMHAPRGQLILPAIVGTRSMVDLKILESIPSIDPNRYVQLVRACRSYQQALWIAESDPNLAWLLLVSAIETAANDVVKVSATPDEILRKSKPELAKYLEATWGPDCARKVAENIASTLKSTYKFIAFVTRFLPQAPDERPSRQDQRVDWTEAGMKKVLSKVYGCRSKSLHEGKPFPAPMLDSPFRLSFSGPAPETPILGLASYSRGGTWTRKEAPINLHCFHFIARGVLLNWWKRSLVRETI